MTKLELLALLDEFPTDAQVIFNDDEYDKVLVFNHLDFSDCDGILGLGQEKPRSKIILHLTEKNSTLGRALEKACTTECTRFCAGTCPYYYSERDNCQRVREFINE